MNPRTLWASYEVPLTQIGMGMGMGVVLLGCAHASTVNRHMDLVQICRARDGSANTGMGMDGRGHHAHMVGLRDGEPWILRSRRARVRLEVNA